MGRYYQSSESVWEKEVRKQEKIGKGIDAIYKLDKMLEKAYEDIEHDRYGNMQTYRYHSLKSEIKECERINEALYEYARRIHDKVVEREHEFTKRISESIEELSHINIKEFTTKNTLGITEKRVMNTSTGGYYTTNGQIVEVKKSRINIVDIQMKTDIMGIDQQIEEEIKKGQGKLSEEEIKKIKEEYYQEYLETSFQHEIYVEGWKKVVSTSIDFLPFIGGAKNIIEGIAGYKFTGEKLSGQERVMYGVLGTVTTVVDVFTLGTAGGMIKGGVYVGKEAAKGSIKQLGKAAILETATSITVGWTSEFASEKLRGMGLGAGEIFAINLLIGVGVGTAGDKIVNLDQKIINKLSNKEKVINSQTYHTWEEMKAANKGTVTKLVKENKPGKATHPRKWLSVEGTSLKIETVQRRNGETYQIWSYTDSTGEVITGIKGKGDIITGELHHYASNKSRKYTKQYEKILKKYDLKLDDPWNKGYIKSHKGSHPKEYHEFVLKDMKRADAYAEGNTKKFLKYYNPIFDTS